VEQALTAYDATLRIELALTNLADGPMPGGLGLHPWFSPGTEVAIHGRSVIASNTDPVAQVRPLRGELDLRRPRPLAAGTDAAWTDIGRPAVELGWPQLGLSAVLDAPAAEWIVAARTADGGPTAVEPQTQAPFGLHRLAERSRGGMALLDPGASLQLVIELRFSPTERG